MSFLFDALKHLLASDGASRRAGLAGMAQRIWNTSGVQLHHDALPEDLEVWHFAKSRGRDMAVTHTVGGGTMAGRELMVLTLADRREDQGDRITGLLASVANAATGLGSITELPDGCLGRSSHRHAAVTTPWPLREPDLRDYERILGASLHLVVPLTEREAAWTHDAGVDALVAAMSEQQVAPWADRAPGQTTLR